MLSPAFRRSHFRRQVPVRPQRRERGRILLKRKTYVLREEPDPLPLRPPQVSHELTWDRNRTSAA